MKYALKLFPSLLIVIFAVSLYAQDQQTPSTLSPQERDAQIHQLHQQLDDIAARLKLLEDRPTPAFNPRGPIATSETPQLPPTDTGGSAATTAAASPRLCGYGDTRCRHTELFSRHNHQLRRGRLLRLQLQPADRPKQSAARLRPLRQQLQHQPGQRHG